MSSTPEPSTPSSKNDPHHIVLEYLKSRGFKKTEQALREELDIGSDKGTTHIHHGLSKLLASLDAAGAEEMLSLDPSDRAEGFRDLESWVDGSLDMYRVSLLTREALSFFHDYSSSLLPTHNDVLHRLATLLLPIHVQSDEIAQRFRNEKYTVRMSRSGFGLLIGWLTEGTGGESPGAGHGFSGEKGRRGRATVMRVVNNHVQFDVTQANPTSISPDTWEESTGLLSALTQVNGSKGYSRASELQSFNVSRGAVKLGPLPIDEGVRQEAERQIREQQMTGFDPEVSGGSQHDLPFPFGVIPVGITAPTLNDLLPRPPLFKTIDIQREVDRIRDARKRIKLDPSILSGNVDIHGFDNQSTTARAKALPSICAYTLHDALDGVPCATFSNDSTLMAAGFSESYIRLFSLKQERLRGMRSDFQESTIRDSASLRRLKEKIGSTTRKLIGHSGPVYSVAFDPLSGSSRSPRYLLSSSADSTARLWSMDTLTNVVAYRGHIGPVWDVTWSPLGIYFATGSRDRTARLWSTDRTAPLRIYAGHLSDVDCVTFHPNSLYLATGSGDWTCRLWDVQKGSCVRVFVGHQGMVSAIAISPDGRYLASAAEDLAINLWDLGSGRRIKKMTGHTASIYSLAFSAESSLLVSGGADYTVRCWDVKGTGGLPVKSQDGDDLDTFAPGSIGGARRTLGGISERDGAMEEESIDTVDLLATFPTRRTPVINVQFTPRNLCLVAGPFLSLDNNLRLHPNILLSHVGDLSNLELYCIFDKAPTSALILGASNWTMDTPILPMSSSMEVDGGGSSTVTLLPPTQQLQPQPQPQVSIHDSPSTPHWDQVQPVREMYCQVPVRVHVRRPGKDTWIYVGRATVSHEVMGHSSRVVVRTTSDKLLVTFGEHSDLQAERRGNFVIVACVESEGGVLSWSLCTVNMSDTLRLLASIELACYRAKQLFADPARFSNTRRRIERVIRDDRRKRHKRKRDEETMISAFAQQKIG